MHQPISSFQEAKILQMNNDSSDYSENYHDIMSEKTVEKSNCFIRWLSKTPVAYCKSTVY